MGGGRSGDRDRRTLDSLGEAKILKALVDAYDQQWPPADVLIERGLGYLVEAIVQLPQVAPAPEAPPVVCRARQHGCRPGSRQNDITAASLQVTPVGATTVAR